MSRSVSVVVSSFVGAVMCCALAAPAFAQDPPAVEPAGIEPPAAEPPVAPPPVAQQSLAHAPESVFDRPGLDLGVRLGYALPFGNTAGDEKISDGFSGAVPLVLEAGYRIDANFTVGALFQYAIAQVKENATTNCGGALSCSGSVTRLGLEGLYNFSLDAAMTPWVGIGTGYEWLGFSQSSGGQSTSSSIKGFEYFSLHAGGDFRLAPQFMLGPFASFSLGKYTSASIDTPNGSGSVDVNDPRMHEWLQLGVRGRFGI